MKETILMSREDLQEMMCGIVKNTVCEVLEVKADETTEMEEIYSVKVLAHKWKVSPQCIWRHVKLGHLTQAAESVRMTLRDHIILADEQYYSFKDNKKL